MSFVEHRYRRTIRADGMGCGYFGFYIGGWFLRLGLRLEFGTSGYVGWWFGTLGGGYVLSFGWCFEGR